MIRACCPECRLRFSHAATVYLDACPGCGQPLQAAANLKDVVGFRLMRLEASPYAAPGSAAAAVAIPITDPSSR